MSTGVDFDEKNKNGFFFPSENTFKIEIEYSIIQGFLAFDFRGQDRSRWEKR
jgi:hypothetical protein